MRDLKQFQVDQLQAKVEEIEKRPAITEQHTHIYCDNLQQDSLKKFLQNH
jgi:hypothetical protein